MYHTVDFSACSAENVKKEWKVSVRFYKCSIILEFTKCRRTRSINLLVSKFNFYYPLDPNRVIHGKINLETKKKALFLSCT